MKIVQPYSWLVTAVLLCLAGCSEQKPGDEGAARISEDSVNGGEQRVATQTPSGRTQLPTPHTVAPDLWITLPAGFSIHAPPTLGYDMLVVSRVDEPLLSDSTQIPLGMLRIVVSDSVFLLTPPGMKVAERKGMVGHYPGIWRYYTGQTPGRPAYYSHELVAANYFAALSPEKEVKNLDLHLFIAGKDTAVINRLIAAAESISTKP